MDCWAHRTHTQGGRLKLPLKALPPHSILYEASTAKKPRESKRSTKASSLELAPAQHINSLQALPQGASNKSRHFSMRLAEYRHDHVHKWPLIKPWGSKSQTVLALLTRADQGKLRKHSSFLMEHRATQHAHPRSHRISPERYPLPRMHYQQ